MGTACVAAGNRNCHIPCNIIQCGFGCRCVQIGYHTDNFPTVSCCKMLAVDEPWMLSADSAVSCVNAFADKVSLTVELSTRCYNCLTKALWLTELNRSNGWVITPMLGEIGGICRSPCCAQANDHLTVYHCYAKRSKRLRHLSQAFYLIWWDLAKFYLENN